MGFRTVVMLNNDQAYAWQNDPNLGQQIMLASNSVGRNNDNDFGYGSVVECVHADTQTLAVLGMYDGFKALAYSSWYRGQTDDELALRLLKEAADKLGYRLVKKTVKDKP